ncbi:protein KAKU4 isoform X2 [Phragmites australis]|uniref:protein KAKU4 isoform X2 n=1 Tax=Phragmites australis TaxID=29695 RepID=UPI002D78EDAC|nr:protein KAKU4 isoform X2 [Phragmites australis]
MASLFGARRRRSPEDDAEDDRSGNARVQRRRLSPEEDAVSPAEATAGATTGTSPGWLSSFVSGARRVFSSVLLFSSPEEAASGEEDDDDGEDGNGLSSDENEDIHDNRGAIVRYSESKLAIEQMVMKETFSRDECDKMVELIKSRVTDSTFPDACEYGTPREIPTRDAGIGHDFTGAWRSLSRDRKFPESVPFSIMRPGSFSPGSPLQASPELCTAAITEAKKWLEEKRQGLGLKPEDNGQCTLNSDMLSSGLDSDMGSPVDLAKSYMQSLPPWQSPYSGSQKFNTSPSGGVHIYDDEGKSKYSISSSKVTMKEDYLSNFWANLEESRRARIGSSGGYTDAYKFRHYGSTSRLFENDTSIFLLGTDEKVGEPAQTNNGAATEPVTGCSIPIAPTEDGNNGIVEPVDLAKDNGNAPQGCHAASEVHPDKVAEGNDMSLTSVSKDATGHSGDVKVPTAEPQIGESHINPASALRPKDAGPPIQASMNGSTHKTSANGLLDQSNANSGLESSGFDNPSCTNSSSAVPPTSNDLTESAANAADVDSVENGTGTKPEELGGSRPSYVRRGRKRVVRGTRGRGK